MLKPLAILLALAPAAAFAQTAPQSVAPEKVLSSVTGDWNDDGSFDRAVLIDNGDEGAGIAVYMSGSDGNMQPAAWGSDIAWSGAIWGTLPSLKLSPSGGLQVYSENSGVGRDRWNETLSLAFRGGQVVVAGVTMHTYDTLDPKNTHSCDINLLTGKGISDKKAVTVAAGGIALSQWSGESLPAPCQF